MIPDELKLLSLATRGAPPAHEWQPVALRVLDLLTAVRRATGWDVCAECGGWAEARDSQGRGLECCAVMCAGCLVELDDAETADRDSDGRPVCDTCADRWRDRMSQRLEDEREYRGIVREGLARGMR